jgi:ABC-type transport system involved in cytochrome c biogenesis permease subunit
MFEAAPSEPVVPEAPVPELAPWSASAERPAYARPTPEPGNSLAIMSLVLALIGLVIVFLSLGFAALLSLPCSIAAWVTGSLGRRQVAKGITKTGDGIAHAGLVLGIVGVVLGVIGAVVWSLLLASGFDPEEFLREIEQGR